MRLKKLPVTPEKKKKIKNNDKKNIGGPSTEVKTIFSVLALPAELL